MIGSTTSQCLRIWHQVRRNAMPLTSNMGQRAQNAQSAFWSPHNVGFRDAAGPVVEMVNIDVAGVSPGVTALAENVNVVDGGSPALQVRIMWLLKPLSPVAVIVNCAAAPGCTWV